MLKVKGADVVLEDRVMLLERLTGMELENPLTTLNVLLPEKFKAALAPVLLKFAVVTAPPPENKRGKLFALAVSVVTLTEFEKVKPVVLALERVKVFTPLIAPLMLAEVVVPQLSVKLLPPPVIGTEMVIVPLVGTALVSKEIVAPSVMVPLFRFKFALVKKDPLSVAVPLVVSEMAPTGKTFVPICPSEIGPQVKVTAPPAALVVMLGMVVAVVRMKVRLFPAIAIGLAVKTMWSAVNWTSPVNVTGMLVMVIAPVESTLFPKELDPVEAAVKVIEVG